MPKACLMKEQYPGVDVLRFLAAMMVFVYHFGFWHNLPADETFALWNPVDAYPLREWTHFGWVGVEIFFVISGFVISFSARNATPGAFFTARALRLAPAVWFCAPLTFLVYLFILNKPPSELLANLIKTMLFVPGNSQIDGAYWTLAIEISFYLLIWFMLFKKIEGAPEKLPVVFMAISLTFWSAYFIASAVWGPVIHNILLIKLISHHGLHVLLVQHGCFFGLGMLLSAMSYRRLSIAEGLCCAGLLIACWLEIVGQNRILVFTAGVALSPWPALGMWTAAMAALLFCTLLNRRLSRALAGCSGVIRTLGLMSYPVYLIHNPIGLACFFLELGGRGFFANLAISVALILFAAWVVATRIEPFVRRWLRAAILTLQSLKRAAEANRSLTPI